MGPVLSRESNVLCKKQEKSHLKYLLYYPKELVFARLPVSQGFTRVIVILISRWVIWYVAPKGTSLWFSAQHIKLLRLSGLHGKRVGVVVAQRCEAAALCLIDTFDVALRQHLHLPLLLWRRQPYAQKASAYESCIAFSSLCEQPQLSLTNPVASQFCFSLA